MTDETIDMNNDENILELYHRISENNSEIEDILTVENENIADLDVQLVEKLEWEPSEGGEFTFEINESEYTIKIKSIPKSEELNNPDHYYAVKEGKGEILENQVNDVDATLNGLNWVSDSNWIGGYKLKFDEKETWWETNAPIGCNTEKFTICGWVEISKDENLAITGMANRTSRVDSGTHLTRLEDENKGDVRLASFRETSDFGMIDESIFPINERLFFAWTGNDNQYKFILKNENEELVNQTSDTEDDVRDSIFGDEVFYFGDNYAQSSLEGFGGMIVIYENTELTESEITNIWEKTK